MSLETALYSYLANVPAIAALVGLPGSPSAAKIYPDHADQNAKPPYVVYLRAGGPSTGDLSGPSLANTRLQIDAYARTAEAVQGLALAINAALDGVAVVLPGLGRASFTRINVSDMPEPEVRLYRRMQEYSIWHPES